ncbi:anti sigma factor C-terminal domain-containing protein [Paenibacillus glucanolyticus]|uniref:anti sigma factor C-terminal domain-containing protein n=1 Tax=Paenibacillus glucanolyticus TaxID=59843 RepID=UPI001D149DD2|nr:anti sigma factor C-terminal domain-containing protein [Paenibacillus glucanolyticus]
MRNDEDQEKQVLRNGDFEDEQPEWSEKKFNRMVWRTRVRLLSNAVGALLLFYLLYVLYLSLSQIFFDTPERNDTFIRSVITAVELHGNGVKVEKTGLPNVEVTPLLTQKATLKLYRDIGGWQVITGEVRAEQPLFGELTYSVEDTGAYLNSDSDMQGAFILPSSIMSEQTTPPDQQRKEEGIEQLGRMDDGNVADMSFSTMTLMQPEQLLKLLEGYDLAVTGMPVYAGELKEFEVGSNIAGGKDYYVPHLTLRPLYAFEEDNRLSMWGLYFTAEDVGKMSEHTANMISDLKWLTESIQYNGVDIDKQRLAYLKKHGVQVYGATVTGPVRELEKLKEQPQFREFRLGRIEVWNWD